MKTFILLIILSLSLTMIVNAQHDHEHHQHHKPAKNKPANKPSKAKSKPAPKADTVRDSTTTVVGDSLEMTKDHHAGHMVSTEDSNVHAHGLMYNAFSKNLPMSRTGSGTSWHPDNSPMFMNMWHKDKWNLMLHYGLFLNYTNQNIFRESAERGDGQLTD